MKSNQNLRVFWKLVNLQDCVWDNHYQIIMETILQEKETIHTTAIQFGTQFYSSASSNEDTRSKSSRGQGTGKIGQNFGVELDKSQK